MPVLCGAVLQTTPEMLIEPAAFEQFQKAQAANSTDMSATDAQRVLEA